MTEDGEMDWVEQQLAKVELGLSVAEGIENGDLEITQKTEDGE